MKAKFSSIESSDALPAGPTSPRLVQALRWTFDPIGLMERCRQRFGPAFTIHMAGQPPFVFLSDPDAIREVFVADPVIVKAGEGAALLEPLVGARSLLLLDGKEHLRERKLVTPAFHGERMRAYGDAMAEVTACSMDRWPTDRVFPIHDKMQEITLEVILRTVFGIAEREQLERMRSLLEEMLSLMGGAAAFIAALLPAMQVNLGPLTPWGRFLRLRAAVDEEIYAAISRCRQAPEGREDVLAQLMLAKDESGEGLSDRALRDEMMTLLVAGHETTATTLSWVFHRLVQHPDVAERARQEVEMLAPGDSFAADDASELRLLDAVVRETLRLHPILPFAVRFLSAPLEVGGRKYPPGVALVPCSYLAQRDPEIWPDPERFDPRRFLERRVSPNHWFPFGGGARRCVGMAFAMFESVLILASVLKRFDIKAAPGYSNRTVRRAITLAPSEGMPVVVSRRDL